MTVNYDHEFLVKVVRSFSVILGLHDCDETVKKKRGSVLQQKEGAALRSSIGL